MSNFLKINIQDVGRGLLVAVFSAVLKFLYDFVVANGLNFSVADLNQALNVAVVAMLGYLVKNLLTNSDGEVFAGENR